MILKLTYPAKPYLLTQAFGIYNPAYLQFGFDHHNGIDFRVDTDGKVVSMCDGVVTDAGFNSGAGNYVRYRTLEPVVTETATQYVEFMVMHASKLLVKKGDLVKIGTPLMVADNTGFSTGPHTHISAYFVDINTGFKMPIGDKNSDYCFDFSKYYTGDYADDIFTLNKIKDLALKVIELLKQKLGLLST